MTRPRDPARQPDPPSSARPARRPSPDEELDRALADSFPASDPPSTTDPVRSVRRARRARRIQSS